RENGGGASAKDCIARKSLCGKIAATEFGRIQPWWVAMQHWELSDPNASSGTYLLSSWLFLRLLGLIYLAAFVSLATQIKGLVGREGILPAAEFLDQRRSWGISRFYRLPTLCWFNVSDGFLMFLVLSGIGLSVLLTI